MSSLSDVTSSLTYNKDILLTLNEITEPLTPFGFFLFTYRKIYFNNSLFHISTRPSWVEHCYDNHLFISQSLENKINNMRCGETSYHLWSQELSDPLYKALHNFDLWNGITIYQKHEEFVEIYAFCSSRENTSVLSFYLNNVDLLLRFIFYFNDKAASLIASKNSSPLIFLPNLSLQKENSCMTREEAYNKFLEQTKINRYFLPGKYRNYSLSPKEYETLFYLSRCKTVKQAAQCMKCSPRTLETYFNRIKIKFNQKERDKLAELIPTLIGIPQPDL